MPDTDWLDDHVELFAVDILTAAENARVQRELDGLSPVERRIYDGRIADTRSAMADLASSYALDPPNTLRDRVLEAAFAATVDTGAPDAGGAAVGGPVEPVPSQSGQPDAPTAGNVVSMDAHRRSRRWAVVAAAAAAVVVALGAGVIVGRTTAPETPPASTVAESDQQVLDVLKAPDAQLAVGDLQDDRGTMSVVTSRERNQAVALLRDLRNPIPDDREYQLWLVGKADNPVSAGHIPPGGANAPTLVDALDNSKVLAVTIEPRGGSAQPTTPILSQIPI
ncbi:anti-sigma factor [Gordonia hankookensis]|uniref:Regulator of SigK n=1 Tax=Gordonia hankookensis TaxID=589403 RepID=A0ABR7W7G9_9ACTN|nr:anti-sigma factor [Gordonia hankookensis]MBD1318770.1 anti-sigma factor [Gordonia hankookensis]